MESEGRQYSLYLIAVFVIVKLCLDTHGVCHFRNQSLAVDGETFSHLFWSRNIGQVAFGVVTVGRCVAFRVGDTGQVVHVVVGHRCGQCAIAPYCHARHVTLCVITDITDICFVALESRG